MKVEIQIALNLGEYFAREPINGCSSIITNNVTVGRTLLKLFNDKRDLASYLP